MMIEKNAVLPVRELYCLPHAGNSYYVAEQRALFCYDIATGGRAILLGPGFLGQAG